MRKESKKILISLCASNTRSAVQNLISDVKRLNIQGLQKLLDEINDSVEQMTAEPLKIAPAPKSRADGSPSGRIIHLMKVGAGLPDQEAIAQLRTELGGSDWDTPPPAKLSLEEWVQRACVKVPSGEIISAALSISNRKKSRRGRKG